ncbi:MAG: hypothetical protein KA347_08035 [Bacteroidia bacterium]|jgi:hypothetical protein|nr:hypothetical protein [Bacteroidota bacterium]MBP6512602.1 hypothetical protein [Bacteroidia bacterium]MBP7244937.1 hypothetical protein [Bacteroidia bacterium]
MANYLSALTRCLVLLLFILTGNPLQAQSNFDAYVTTSAPVNDVVTGTMFITLTDTNQIDLVEVKVGSKEGHADLANHQFTYDQTSGLPAGMTWQRTGYRITISIGSFAYSDLQFGYVRLKNSSGVWSDTFAFVTN